MLLNGVSSCSLPLGGGSVSLSVGGWLCLRCWSVGLVGPPQGCLLLDLTTTSEVYRDSVCFSPVLS